jgi:hypothetical protein
MCVQRDVHGSGRGRPHVGHGLRAPDQEDLRADPPRQTGKQFVKSFFECTILTHSTKGYFLCTVEQNYSFLVNLF